MNENRLPPGYVPLTIHELNGQSPKQGSSRRNDGDRSRRNGKYSNNNKNNHNRVNKRRPRAEEKFEDEEPPIEE